MPLYIPQFEQSKGWEQLAQSISNYPALKKQAEENALLEAFQNAIRSLSPDMSMEDKLNTLIPFAPTSEIGLGLMQGVESIRQGEIEQEAEAAKLKQEAFYKERDYGLRERTAERLEKEAGTARLAAKTAEDKAIADAERKDVELKLKAQGSYQTYQGKIVNIEKTITEKKQDPQYAKDVNYIFGKGIFTGASKIYKDKVREFKAKEYDDETARAKAYEYIVSGKITQVELGTEDKTTQAGIRRLQAIYKEEQRLEEQKAISENMFFDIFYEIYGGEPPEQETKGDVKTETEENVPSSPFAPENFEDILNEMTGGNAKTKKDTLKFLQ